MINISIDISAVFYHQVIRIMHPKRVGELYLPIIRPPITLGNRIVIRVSQLSIWPIIVPLTELFRPKYSSLGKRRIRYIPVSVLYLLEIHAGFYGFEIFC